MMKTNDEEQYLQHDNQVSGGVYPKSEDVNKGKQY
jgi:hypothetical protein